MKLYLKGDYTKRVPYGYLELAGKIWFPEEKQVSYSNSGDNEQLQEDYFSNLSLRKGTFDKRWVLLIMLKGIPLLLLLLRKKSLFYKC